jgi:hypothetical protein
VDGLGKLKGIPANNYYEVEDLINGLLEQSKKGSRGKLEN